MRRPAVARLPGRALAACGLAAALALVAAGGAGPTPRPAAATPARATQPGPSAPGSTTTTAGTDPGGSPADPSGPADPAASALTSGATSAAQPDPDPLPSGSSPTIALVDQDTWVHDGEAFEALVRVARAPAGAALRVVAHEPLRSRSDFDDSLQGDLGEVEYEGPATPVDQLPTSGVGVRSVGFDVDEGFEQGVHPVDVQVLDGAGEVVAGLVTYAMVVRETEGLVPLSVAVVMDVASPPALQPDGSVAMSATTLDRIEERVAALERAPKVPLTVAPRPETVDGLVGAEERGFELLARLGDASVGRPVLARPYTDIDVAALMDADLVGEVNAQAEAGAQVVRSRFGTEPLPGVWLVSGTVGDPAARLVHELGVGRAVVDRAAVAEAPGLGEGRVPEEPVRLGEGGPEVMVNDEALAQRLTGQDQRLDAQRFVAELAMVWFERPAIGRGVVVRVPADAELDPELFASALGELTEAAAVRPVTLPELFDAVPPTEGESRPVAAPAAHEVTGDLAPLSRRLAAARVSVGGIGGVVQDDALGRSLSSSLLLATGADTPNDQRNAYVGRVTTELSELDSLIDAQDEFRITLTSRSGSIPLNINNGGSEPAEVRIELQSDQLEFPEGSEIRRTLEPGGNRIDIPVRVLASGAFPLDITVTSPDGTIELDSTRFDIRSTAVSGVGLVLSVGAVLFLAVWWVRNWRATSRSRRLVPPEGGPSGPGGPDGTGGSDGRNGPDGGGPAERRPPAPVATERTPEATHAGWYAVPPPPPGAHRPEGEDDYRPAHLSGHRRHR